VQTIGSLDRQLALLLQRALAEGFVGNALAGGRVPGQIAFALLVAFLVRSLTASKVMLPPLSKVRSLPLLSLAPW